MENSTDQTLKFTEGWMPDEQVELICASYNKVKHLKGSIVELGCWQGKSTIGIANHIYPEKVICVDHWRGNEIEGDVSVRIAKERNVYLEFQKNMKIGTKGNFTVFKKDCFDFLENYMGKIKFLHVDADHHYDSVKRTLELAIPKMVEGGIICGDDFNSKQEDVAKALLEQFKNKPFGHIYNFWWTVISKEDKWKFMKI